MGRVFSLKGRTTYAGGEPAGGVLVAIVDWDPECDDLLGFGTTNDAGEFQLSFTKAAFNQEAGEDEELPDLYVIVSIIDGGNRVPVLRRDFPGVKFDAEEDLGAIALPHAKGDPPIEVGGLRSVPGHTKIARRTRLDDDLVQRAAAEIAPNVEALTGWSNLLDGVQFEVVDDFLPIMQRYVQHAGGESELSERERAYALARADGCEVGTMAMWEHRDHTIYINRPVLEAQNYDGLRVVLGHELVHVGQSKAHPETDAELRRIQAVAHAHWLAGTASSAEEEEASTRFMANIEGFATYVEEELLRVFTHGTSFTTAKLDARRRQVERRWGRKRTAKELETFNRQSWHEILGQSASKKGNQYLAGVAAYRAKKSFRFDPTLRPELHFDRGVLKVLEEAATGDSALSKFELAVIYSEGKGGVPKDSEKAKALFRGAWEGGVKGAVMMLALEYPRGDPERLKWLRVGAEAEHVVSMQMLGLELLYGNQREGIGWLERAAAAGDEDSPSALARVYEQGIGVPRDLVSARMWKKRAEKAAKK